MTLGDAKKLKLSSPRMWGCSFEGIRKRLDVHVFPTYVGMFLIHSVFNEFLDGLPTYVGMFPILSAEPKTAQSHPHARGMSLFLGLSSPACRCSLSLFLFSILFWRFLMIKTVVEKREVEVCDECGCDAKYIRVKMFQSLLKEALSK